MQGRKLVGVVVALVLVSATAVYAAQGRWGGWGWCQGPYAQGPNARMDAASEQQRDELFAKQSEIRKELAHDEPDLDRVARLEKEAVDIRLKIAKSAGSQVAESGRGWGPGARGGCRPDPGCDCRNRSW